MDITYSDASKDTWQSTTGKIVKITSAVILSFSLCVSGYAAKAKRIDTDTTNFDNNLSASDSTVQAALETLDELSAGGGSVSDTVYGVGWNGSTTTAPSQNAVYDKIETLAGGHDAVTIGTANGLSLATQVLSMAAASDTVVGTVELATTAETTTGTDATRAVTPDGLEDGYNGSANVTTLGTITSGTWQGTAVADTYVADDITASNYLPLAGGTMTGSLVTDNLGIEFEDSDTNPTCGAGEYKIYADLSETTFKKCMNGSATDLDTTGGTPAFSTLSGGTNTSAAMVVGTGASLGVSGSGTITATDLTAGSSVVADAEVDNNLTIAGGTIGTSAITLVQGTAPTPTAEGVIEWDTDDNRIMVGDGASQQTFYSGAHTTDTNANTACTGTTTYLDGEGNCDDISSVYQAADADLTTWAGVTPGTGVATALAVNVGSAGAVVLNGGALGTPSSGTLTNATGLPISTGVSGLGTGVATFLATPSSANLASALTTKTGTGVAVFGTAPTFTTSIAFNAVTDTVAGIQNQNLVDKTATEAITGDWDFGGGGIEIENGTTPPACTVGQIYLDTDATSGQQLMACEAGTFVKQGDGGGAETNSLETVMTGVADDEVPVGSSADTATYIALPSCSNATTSKLLYNTSTNAFSCGTDQTGGAGSGATNLTLPVQSAKLTGAFVTMTPAGCSTTASTGASISAASGAWKLLFDAGDSPDEAAVWQFVMPSNYASDPILDVHFSMLSGEANEVEFEAAIMCNTPTTDTANIDTASFANCAVGTATTVSATAGEVYTQSITLTDDSCAAGDDVWIWLSTDADDATNDDATGDREVVGVEFSYS